MVYEWKLKVCKEKAQDVGELCESLEQTVGLNAHTLLDASRPKDALLHNAFEWDDKEAAEQYRLCQARSIINNLVIKAEGIAPTKAFVTFERQAMHASSYENVVTVMSDDDKRAALFKQAKAELGWFKQKYSNLKELSKVFEAIDQL